MYARWTSPLSSGRGDGRASATGQGVVELALALPLLVLLSAGIADVGRAFHYREAVTNGTREALHLATAGGQQATGNTACSSAGGSVTTTLGSSAGSPVDTIATVAALESSSNGGASGSAILGARTTVTWHCAGTAAVTNSTATSTDPAIAGSAAIEVRTSYTLQPLLPLVGSLVGTPVIVSDLVGRAAY